MSVTAKELAKTLRLSEAAVSLALNHKPGVSQQTRQRVWNKARELGYDFSRIATVHAGNKGTVCLLVYSRSNVIVGRPYASLLEAGALAGCKRGGYDMDVRSMHGDGNVAEHLLAPSREGAYADMKALLQAGKLVSTAASPTAASSPRAPWTRRRKQALATLMTSR